MPVTTIGPDEYISLEFKRRGSGSFEFEIEADHPVRTYVVGPKALQRFEEGSKTFKYWGGFPDPRGVQQQKVWIPFKSPVYLIISNPSDDESVDVNYEVYY
jgi:hypothetical protein